MPRPFDQKTVYLLTIISFVCVSFLFYLQHDGAVQPEPLTPILYGKVRPDKNSITLATFTTVDRLAALLTMANQWAPQHIVVAVYVPLPTAQSNNRYVALSYLDPEARRQWTRTRNKVVQFHKAHPSVSNHVDIHFVVQGLNYFGLPAAFFPYNNLRNIAMNHVPTDFVFIADIDLFPAKNFMEEIGAEMLARLRKTSKLALVVPSFSRAIYNLTTNDIVDPRFSSLDPQTISELAQQQLPRSKRQVLKQLSKKRIRVTSTRPTQAPTNYPQWFQCSQPYKVDYWSGYEPYLILRTQTAPRFNEDIKGYDGDKQAYVFELALRGYTFEVQPSVFVVHIRHSVGAQPYFSGTGVYQKMKKFLLQRTGCSHFGESYPVHPDSTKKAINDFIESFKTLEGEVPENCELRLPQRSKPKACTFIEWQRTAEPPQLLLEEEEIIEEDEEGVERVELAKEKEEEFADEIAVVKTSKLNLNENWDDDEKDRGGRGGGGPSSSRIVHTSKGKVLVKTSTRVRTKTRVV